MEGWMDGRWRFSTSAATQKRGIQVQILTWFHEHPQKCDKIHSNNLGTCDPGSIKGLPFIELVSRGKRDGVNVIRPSSCSLLCSNVRISVFMDEACLFAVFV